MNTHTRDELAEMQAQGVDLFGPDYLRSAAAVIQTELDERARILAHVDDQMRRCLDLADEVIRSALGHRHPAEDVDKAIAIEELQAVRDLVRECVG